MERVVLNIVHNCGVVSVGPRGMKGFVAVRELGDIPNNSASVHTAPPSFTYHNLTVWSSLPVARWPAS